jgi:metal-dependent amidase/aminoacylase/carboxypeptidase family protein
VERPPSYETLSAFPVTVNDPSLTASLATVLPEATEIEPMMGSEDFGLFGTAAGVPSVFWGISGSFDGAPGNHSPQFAPSIDPTLNAGVTAMLTAARHVLN